MMCCAIFGSEMMSKVFCAPLAAAAVAVVSMTSGAEATSITAANPIFQHGSANTGTITDTGPGSGGNAQAGVFSMHNNTDGYDFLAWCLDLYSGISGGATYNYTMQTAADNPFAGTNGPFLNATQTATIENLFETNATAVQAIYGGVNNTNSAGFQLALWEIVYETAAGPYSLTNGSFRSVANGVRTAAEGFLANLGGTIEANYDLTYWASNSGRPTGSTQNLVSISPAAVPVPAAGLMLLTGLAGFGVASRRRRKG